MNRLAADLSRGVSVGLVVLSGIAIPPVMALDVSDALARQPPSTAWLRDVLRGEEGVAWAEIEGGARDAAIKADRQNRNQALEGWLMLARWARLLGSDQTVVTNRWVNAINNANLGHPNMAPLMPPPPSSLSAILGDDTTLALIENVEFSRSLFDLLTPYDNLPEVLRTLDQLYRADPALFKRYEQLALAIAVVFDVPPPPRWPHGQVSERLLSRKRPEALDAFVFWTQADGRHQTLHRLNQLDAAELKFVVSAAAPFAELEWVQDQMGLDFEALPQTYDAVTYRMDRLEQGIYDWPHASYALPDILKWGGICIDQGYFATEAGRAKGVPTLLFRGVGLDGRHAWFGYLDAQKQWQLDVGRYAEQRYVSGVAFDPQTWDDVNDHELSFLAERFRLLPQYQQSRARQWLAEELLREGRYGEALNSARRATNYETRNVAAWDLRILAEEGAKLSLVKREATMRAAARAFQRYPDLEIRFMRGVISIMRERGQTSAADHEESLLAKRFSADRTDLALGQAAEMLNRSLARDDTATQVKVFENALRQFGVSAGMTAFDRLVHPFFTQAMVEGRPGDAIAALMITRRLIPVEPGSQFDRELSELYKVAAQSLK